jgi:hypothetical protein
VKALPLVCIRNGKHTVQWPALLARFAVYFVMVGCLVAVVTWISDVIFEKHDLANLWRLLSIPGFLASLFVVHDVRRDSRLPPKDLPGSDRGTHFKRE